MRQFLSAGAKTSGCRTGPCSRLCSSGGTEGDADRNDDGYTTGRELGTYLQEKVVDYPLRGQHPPCGKSNNPALEKGDFVFVRSQSPPAGSSASTTFQSPAAAGGAIRVGAGPNRPELEATLRAWNDVWHRLDIATKLSFYNEDARIHTRVKTGVSTV